MHDKNMLPQVSWLTPSEIFTPYYGQAVASQILQEHRKDSTNSLQIFELGGGTGTMALDIMNHLQEVSLIHNEDQDIEFLCFLSLYSTKAIARLVEHGKVASMLTLITDASKSSVTESQSMIS